MLCKASEPSARAVQHGGPFSVYRLREAIQSHAGRYHVPPDAELVRLAALLNMIDATYKNSTNLMLAADARCALWVLMRFFDEGKPAHEKVGIDPRITNLVKEMEAHARAVGMNAGGMMPPYEGWRDFAHWVGHAFLLAMKAGNPDKPIGFTNEGPIARLTAWAIEVIVGKMPKVYNVGQHLKQPYQKKRASR
jgi:hypothetical protein